MSDGILGTLLSAGNRLRSNIRGLLSDPLGTIDQNMYAASDAINSSTKPWDDYMTALRAKSVMAEALRPAALKSLADASGNFVGVGIIKNIGLMNKAKSLYGLTREPSETGYVMDDGSRLDFSGRHNSSGYEKSGTGFVPSKSQPDYLQWQRNIDHREMFGLSSDTGAFQDQTGAVRYSFNVGASSVSSNKPSMAQIETIVKDFRKSNHPLIWDIDNGSTGYSFASKTFDRPTVDAVSNWLDEMYKKAPIL